MIWKVISWSFFFSLIIAIVLYLAGIRYVSLDNNFMKLFISMNNRINAYSIQIPTIPQIAYSSTQSDFINGLVNFFNGLVGFINFIIMAVNMLINMVNLIFSFISSIVAYLAGFGATI